MVMNKPDRFDESFESLEAIADTIGEELQCPVTIEDANHRLLAYSSHDPQTDPARLATIIGRRVPEKVIRSLWQVGVMQQLMASHEAVQVAGIGEIGLGNRLAIAIRKNDEVLGYIWVVEGNKKFDDFEKKRLVKAAQAAKTKLLQKQMKSRKEELEYQEFFWQLLTGYLNTDAGVKERAKTLGVNLPQFFDVVILKFDTEITDKLNQQIRYMIATTQSIRIVFHAFIDAQLVLLTEREQDSRLDTQVFLHFMEQMKSRFGFAPIAAGRGSSNKDYSMVEQCYQEAAVVLDMRTMFPFETEDIYNYSDLGYLRYLPTLLKEKQKHSDRNENLQKLSIYDQQNNSNLVQTLAMFLSTNSNLKETAQLLHIHTNTLIYRLKRISEIGSIDLNNMNQIITIYLDLKTDKLLNEP
jgi:DNA-binding PucR family transcriptional regulator